MVFRSSGRSVCLSVTVMNPAKMAELIEMRFELWTWVGLRNHVVDWSPDPPHKWQFWGRKGRIVKYRDSAASSAKNSWTDRDAVWDTDSDDGPKEHPQLSVSDQLQIYIEDISVFCLASLRLCVFSLFFSFKLFFTRYFWCCIARFLVLYGALGLIFSCYGTLELVVLLLLLLDHITCATYVDAVYC